MRLHWSLWSVGTFRAKITAFAIMVDTLALKHEWTTLREKGCMEGQLLCRFSDAGMTRLSTRCGGRRPKSAKARNRGKWGTGGAAGVYGDLAAVR